MYQEFLSQLKGITADEFSFLQQVMAPMTEQQAKQFILFYSSKRKTAQDILIFTLLGFIIVAGVQRFVIGQIGMGILYLLTGGLCLIGTIVDLINHQTLAREYNQGQALEAASLVKGMYP